MIDWLRENLSLISSAAAFIITVSGGFLALWRWNTKHLDEKLAMEVSTAVNDAVGEIMQDFSAVRERVATLEAHFTDTKEDIQEIKGKLDTLGGHVLQLPQKLAEVLKR